jgi:threonine dehydratase
MQADPLVPDVAAVRQAAAHLEGVAHRTPVMTCRTLDGLAGRRLFLKCEQFQKAGAFKFRGAMNAIASLSPEQAARGVVTHSSGNHAQALSLAARMRGIPAHIVMPSNASAIKRRAVEGYGGRVITCEPTLASREATAARVIEETASVLIHAYDDARIIAGQATAALELLDEVADLDAIVVPIGGGGLGAGACLAVQAARQAVRVFGAEPAGADDAARSLAVGERLPQLSPDTIADGLRTSLGQLNWAILRQQMQEIITVSDAQILAAMRLCWERGKLMIETSSATAVAAVLSDRFRQVPGLSRVGVILTGGNVDLDRLPWRQRSRRG